MASLRRRLAGGGCLAAAVATAPALVPAAVVDVEPPFSKKARLKKVIKGLKPQWMELVADLEFREVQHFEIHVAWQDRGGMSQTNATVDDLERKIAWIQSEIERMRRRGKS